MRFAFALATVSVSISSIAAFEATRMARGIRRTMKTTSGRVPRRDLAFRRPSTKLMFFDDEADVMEEYAGGMRHEMVDLPDSLVDTTVFVGNLCEFVTDEILSELFQLASSLNFVPACVARKANSNSLRYGFVTFPTVAEKEVSLMMALGFALC